MNPPPPLHKPWARDLRELLGLAAPVVAVQVGLMLMGVVDVIMVGRVSPTDLAAVALGNLYFMSAAILGMGILMALDPLVSQAVGAGDEPAVARAVQRGLVLATFLTPPIGLALYVAGPVFRALGQDPAVAPVAARYALVSIPGVLPFLLFVVLRQTLQAQGRLRPIVITIVLANLLNVGLNWVLIFGHLGAPAMGAVGSGWASTLGRWAMCALLLVAAWPALAPSLVPLRRDALAARPLGAMFRLGLPIGLQFLLEVGVFSVVGLLMGRIGAVELAGHQVALNMASLTFMVPLGIGAAAAVLVGRAVGRHDPAGVRRAARLSLLCGATFMALSGLTLLTFPRAIARAYSPDAGVVAVAAALIPLAGLFQVFDGLQVVAGGVLRGIGDTRAPLVVNTIGFWVLGLPTSLALGFGAGLGPVGLWWGFVVGLAAVALFLLARVRSRLRRTHRRIDLDGEAAA